MEIFPAERILFEDNHLIAINKRPGEIIQEDKTGDISLEENLKQFIKERDQKPGNVFLGVAHRLDRPVSGLVLFAKTSKALERLNEIFRTREVEKTYWAVVQQKPSTSEGKLIHFISRNEVKNMSKAHVKEVPNSKRAELDYRIMAQSDRYFLLEIKPLTGRHHQIRVQLSKIGSPIKGDIKYGYARTNPGGFIHLHARELRLIHPVKKEPLVITADPSGDKLWEFFLSLKSTS